MNTNNSFSYLKTFFLSSGFSLKTHENDRPDKALLFS